ncbi:MAG: Gfo/Idh/MocA family oxidoreductase [Abditibacteriaceae bacterium]
MTNNSTKVRVGVIGVGIGKAHLTGYSNVEQAEVVALCDIDEERVRATAKEFNLDNAKIYTDYRALLDDPDIDAVSVGLPNFLHMPVVVDALNAGKHVICEKPLAMSAEQGQQMVDAAANNDKFCMVAQVNRFRDDSKYLKQIISEGQLGNIYYANCGYLRRSGIPGYGGWFTTKSKSGGGPLIDLGVHLLDLTWWLAGCPNPVSVTGVTYAEIGPRKEGIGTHGHNKNIEGTFDVEDLAVALIRFDNGLTINLEVSWALHLENGKMWSHLYGNKGGCTWGDSLAIHTDLNNASVNTTINVSAGDCWTGEMQHFIDSIVNNTAPDPSADQGVVMMKMLEGIYKSAETKREVLI